MNLKSILKSLKLNESTISMILGVLVIITVGVLVINYFKSTDSGDALPEGVSTQENGLKVKLPTTHTVAENESLWSISQKYYGTGYNWVDIAEANKLSRADIITKGQTLTIPDVQARTIESSPAVASPAPSPTLASTISPKPTATPVITATPKATAEPAKTETITETTDQKITGESYTVVRGDSLWKIAERAYGDGNKWVEIARANKLVNPNLIHAGNNFVIPR